MQRLQDYRHYFGPMEDAMDMAQVARKGNIMNVLEKLYICIETHFNNLLNDKSTLGCNNIFEFLIHHKYTRYRCVHFFAAPTQLSFQKWFDCIPIYSRFECVPIYSRFDCIPIYSRFDCVIYSRFDG